MTFEKITTVSVQENVTQSLLKSILSGEVKPGDKFPPERELAALLGVSRGTVHQAILDLSSKGFLEIIPRHGTVVCNYRENQTPQSLTALMSYGSDHLSYPLFNDLMATRRLLETECARLACKNIYPSTLQKMKETVNALEAHDEDFYKGVYRFHYSLVLASGNSIYSMIYRGFESILITLIKKHFDMRPENCDETIRHSRLLISCLETGDEDGAAEETRILLDLGVGTLKKAYDN